MSSAHTIGRLARAAGVHVETVRFYQRRGLVAEPARPSRGVRRYSDEHLRRLRFIKTAQGAGFSLAEIAALIDLEQHRSCRTMRAVVAEKLRTIEDRLEKLTGLRGELQHWLTQCDANDSDDQCPALSAITTVANGELRTVT